VNPNGHDLLPLEFRAAEPSQKIRFGKLSGFFVPSATETLSKDQQHRQPHIMRQGEMMMIAVGDMPKRLASDRNRRHYRESDPVLAIRQKRREIEAVSTTDAKHSTDYCQC